MTERMLPQEPARATSVDARKPARKFVLPASPSRAYAAKGGAYYTGDSLELLQSSDFDSLLGRVQLILTSPPYPLNEKKSYGNLTGKK